MTEAAQIASPAEPLNAVAALRAELGLTLAEMGERVGLSKSQMHEVERTGRASLPVALRIEALSADAAGRARIDAADLCEDVRAARASLIEAGLVHAAQDSAAPCPQATGKAGQLSGGASAQAAAGDSADQMEVGA